MWAGDGVLLCRKSVVSWAPLVIRSVFSITCHTLILCCCSAARLVPFSACFLGIFPFFWVICNAIGPIQLINELVTQGFLWASTSPKLVCRPISPKPLIVTGSSMLMGRRPALDQICLAQCSVLRQGLFHGFMRAFFLSLDDSICTVFIDY